MITTRQGRPISRTKALALGLACVAGFWPGRCLAQGESAAVPAPESAPPVSTTVVTAAPPAAPSAAMPSVGRMFSSMLNGRGAARPQGAPAGRMPSLPPALQDGRSMDPSQLQNLSPEQIVALQNQIQSQLQAQLAAQARNVEMAQAAGSEMSALSGDSTGTLPLPIPGMDSSINAIDSMAGGPMMALDSGTSVPLYEMDESDAPIKILPEVAQRILLQNRRFEYNANGEEDPMIIPWIRADIMAGELINAAKKYLAQAGSISDNGQKDKLYRAAIDECDRLIRLDSGTRYAQQAQAIKEQAIALVGKLVQSEKPAVAEPPKPPEWILLNTKAVIFDRSAAAVHIALVGDSMLKVNDTVPRYPQIKVVEIKRDSVLYEYQYEPASSYRFPVALQVEVKLE